MQNRNVQPETRRLALNQRRAAVFVSVVMMLLLCGFLIAMAVQVNLVNKQSVRQNFELEQAREIAVFVANCVRQDASLADEEQLRLEVADGKRALATISRTGEQVVITATFPVDSPSGITVKQELTR